MNEKQNKKKANSSH